jgi:hypothetical protein
MGYTFSKRDRATLVRAMAILNGVALPSDEQLTDWARNNIMGATISLQQLLRDPELPTFTPACRCESNDVFAHGRCSKHAAMMQAIRRAVDSNERRVNERIWALQDGYGDPGFTPVQGWDWSGIRDSSVAAVEAMYAVAVKGRR